MTPTPEMRDMARQIVAEALPRDMSQRRQCKERIKDGEWDDHIAVRAALTAIIETSEKVAWPDISTAPLDRRIRLFADGREWTECEWQEGGVISEDGFWVYWHMVESDSWFCEIKNPTHWQEITKPSATGCI